MESYPTKWRDYESNPQELVGKTVLYESGQTYSTTTNKSIRIIEKVTKTGFRISEYADALFSLRNGSRKGLNGRADMATVSQCRLITPERGAELEVIWANNKAKRELNNTISNKIAD